MVNSTALKTKKLNMLVVLLCLIGQLHAAEVSEQSETTEDVGVLSWSRLATLDSEAIFIEATIALKSEHPNLKGARLINKHISLAYEPSVEPSILVVIIDATSMPEGDFSDYRANTYMVRIYPDSSDKEVHVGHYGGLYDSSDFETKSGGPCPNKSLNADASDAGAG